jgi:hydroxypyruvate isomerase
MELSACIEWLFGEDGAPFEERVVRAGLDGFERVEFWGWRSKDMAAVGDALRQTGLRLTSFVSEPTGHLVDRATHQEFLAGVEESAALALKLNCAALVVLSGDELDGVPRADQHGAMVDGLKAAAPVARRFGVRLVLEPLSRIDEPKNFLMTTSEGLDIVDEVADPSVALLFDLYHAVAMGEDARVELASRVDRVGHVQIADYPGRHEPGTGTIAWHDTLQWLRDAGYGGPVGLEYMPSGRTHESLELIRKLAAGLS